MNSFVNLRRFPISHTSILYDCPCYRGVHQIGAGPESVIVRFAQIEAERTTQTSILVLTMVLVIFIVILTWGVLPGNATAYIIKLWGISGR